MKNCQMPGGWGLATAPFLKLLACAALCPESHSAVERCCPSAPATQPDEHPRAARLHSRSLNVPLAPSPANTPFHSKVRGMDAVSSMCSGI